MPGDGAGHFAAGDGAIAVDFCAEFVDAGFEDTGHTSALAIFDAHFVGGVAVCVEAFPFFDDEE